MSSVGRYVLGLVQALVDAVHDDILVVDGEVALVALHRARAIGGTHTDVRLIVYRAVAARGAQHRHVVLLVAVLDLHEGAHGLDDAILGRPGRERRAESSDAAAAHLVARDAHAQLLEAGDVRVHRHARVVGAVRGAVLGGHAASGERGGLAISGDASDQQHRRQDRSRLHRCRLDLAL